MNYRLVGSSAHAKIDYRAFKMQQPATILVLGSEQKGLSQEQMAACDVTLSLPMKGRVSSLNLAVAAGILMYRSCESIKIGAQNCVPMGWINRGSDSG